MAKVSKNKIKGMLQSIQDKPELMARAQQLVALLQHGETEPADSIDADLKYTNGPKANQRKRLSYFDQQQITNSDGETRILIGARAPDGGKGAGVALINDKGNISMGLAVNNGQSSLQFLDDDNVIRLQIGLGATGIPYILFRDEKGVETFGLTDAHVRFGKANEEQIELVRDKTGVTLSLRGKKNRGTAAIAVLNGQPAIALADSKNIYHVGMTADPKATNIGILKKGKYIWTATDQPKEKK